MAGTHATNKLKQAKRRQAEEEYVSLDDSDSDTKSEDWEQFTEEAEAAAVKRKVLQRGKPLQPLLRRTQRLPPQKKEKRPCNPHK